MTVVPLGFSGRYTVIVGSAMLVMVLLPALVRMNSCVDLEGGSITPGAPSGQSFSVNGSAARADKQEKTKRQKRIERNLTWPNRHCELKESFFKKLSYKVRVDIS
jgi:hypothetical protein